VACMHNEEEFLRAWYSRKHSASILFFETSGEFFGVWELVKGIVPQGRERFANKQFLVNVEKAAQRYESWIESRSPGHTAAMRQFMQQMRGQSAAAAKG
jgi:hypothetical protein